MKTLSKIWNVFTTVLVIFVVALAVLLVGVRLIGLTPYTVLSNSMYPTYRAGDIIYVKQVELEEIAVEDPITFVLNVKEDSIELGEKISDTKPKDNLLVATHRVVDIDVIETKMAEVLDENGNAVLDEDGDPVYEEVPRDTPAYYFTTKGDNNDNVDGTPVYGENVLGVPKFHVHLLGYLSSWLQTRQGMIMGIAIALVIIILTFLPDILKWADEPAKKDEKSDKEKAEEAEVVQEAEAAAEDAANS